MSDPIPVNDAVLVPASAIEVSAARASGPGGQNVNKVSSKVDMRVDIEQIAGLSEAAKGRLRAAAASRLDAAGRLWVVSQKTRDQARNLEDARDKIRALIAAALVEPKPRKKTRPSRGAVEARLSDKRRTSERKRVRTSRGPSDD